MTVVTPPDAAARVPVAKPSHSVRPGSFKWTWASTRPGSRSLEPWLTYVVDEGKEVEGRTAGTMETIFPVVEERDIVAGERMRVSLGKVSTALVDTRTVKGSDVEVGTEADTVILAAVLEGREDGWAKEMFPGTETE